MKVKIVFADGKIDYKNEITVINKTDLGFELIQKYGEFIEQFGSDDFSIYISNEDIKELVVTY